MQTLGINAKSTLNDDSMININKFFYSNFYLLLLLIITVTGWMFDATILGMYFLLFIAITSLLTNRDIAPVLPIFPLMLMTVSSSMFMDTEVNKMGKANLLSVAILGVLLALAIIYNIVFYKQKVKMGKLTLPLICVSIALFAGGLGSEYMSVYKDGLVFVLSLGPLILGVYVLAISFTHVPKYVDAKLYFAKIITLISLVCVCQVLLAHIELDAELIDHFRAVLDVGWTNRAGLVIMIYLGLSSAFYYADNAKHCNFILYNFAMAMFAGLVLTGSRGGILFGAIELAVIIIYLLVKGNHKIQFGITLAIWATIIIVFIARHSEGFLALLLKIKDLGLSSTGRIGLFKEGSKLFAKYPIFGVSIGYRGPHYFAPECMYWFHSTIIQVLASMGLFGGLCYGYYYAERIKIMAKKSSPFNAMMIIAIVTFELHSLIDAGSFEPLPFLYTAVLLNFFIEYENMVDEEGEIAACTISLDEMNSVQLDYATNTDNASDVASGIAIDNQTSTSTPTNSVNDTPITKELYIDNATDAANNIAIDNQTSTSTPTDSVNDTPITKDEAIDNASDTASGIVIDSAFNVNGTK